MSSPATPAPEPAPPGAAAATGDGAKRLLEAEEGLLRAPRNWQRYLVPVIAVAWSLFQLSVATWLTVNSVKLRAIHLAFAVSLAYLSFPSARGAGSGRIGRWRRRQARRILRLLQRTRLLAPLRVLRVLLLSALGGWTLWVTCVQPMGTALWTQRAILWPNLRHWLANLVGDPAGRVTVASFRWTFPEGLGPAWLLAAAGLVLLAYSWLRPRRNRVPLSDMLLAACAAFAALYVIIDFEHYYSGRMPNPRDTLVGLMLIVLLCEACRRTIGPALVLVVGVMMLYCVPSLAQGLSDVLSWSGVPLATFIQRVARSTEGIYTTPLDVSAKVVFLFVLFGALLERAGGGRFFIQLALSLLGGLRGGPAKASVLASGLTGMISGSSIANIVTTGTFTIPLMKEVGYPAKKAAAIEVAASTDGQLAPPVMGAAAFIIAEYVGIPYRTVVLAAAVPALASYCALFYITHLEACKMNLRGLPRHELPRFWAVLRDGWYFLIPLAVLLWKLILEGRSPENAAAWAIGFMLAIMLLQRPLFLRFHRYWTLPALALLLGVRHLANHTAAADGASSGWTLAIGAIYAGSYGVLLAALWADRRAWKRRRATAAADGKADAARTPGPASTPTPAAPARHGGGGLGRSAAGVWEGVRDIVQGLAMGGRNMVAVAVACATAGIVVGVVNLGPGGNIASIIDHLAGGNVLLLLIITAIGCLIIGMGLPTTATYVIMAALLANVIVHLGTAQGMVVFVLAAHLFVFYFGILADDTPPVGLAAYAASAIAKSPPIPTGLQAFSYDIRTAILPFMFIFNTDLVLHTLDAVSGEFVPIRHVPTILGAALCAIAGNLAFAAATQGYLLTRMGHWAWLEVPALLTATWAFFRPDHTARMWGLAHEQRYWCALIGVALVGLVALNQRRRIRPEDRAAAPPAADAAL